MRFYFPDSQDQIDPTFDFDSEERSIHRIRQRDDRYAHEVLRRRPYDGILVSKPNVDGLSGSGGRYSISQRQRLYRQGAKRFFRLDQVAGPPLVVMGDNGAFSYVSEENPPYTVDDVIDFYEECGFDFGTSLDHVVFGYDESADDNGDHACRTNQEWVRRQELTLTLADEFLRRHYARRCSFVPYGVAQGWSPNSYRDAVDELQKMGYRHISLGGMVPLKTEQILNTLKAISTVRHPHTQIHLLGVTRPEHAPEFARLGVTSIDSTSPFRRAFKDERDNYWTRERTYTALRIPQVDGNPRLKRRIAAGEVDQGEAIHLERECLELVSRFEKDEVGVDEVVAAIAKYERLWDGRNDRSAQYRDTLAAAPWRRCDCGICEQVGIHVAIFRGTERNKRRGFHNIAIFNATLQEQLR